MQPDPTTLAALTRVLARFAKLDPARITIDSRLADAYGVDSLSMIDLVVTLEDEFGLRIPDEAAERFETVGDLIDFLDRGRIAVST